MFVVMFVCVATIIIHGCSMNKHGNSDYCNTSLFSDTITDSTSCLVSGSDTFSGISRTIAIIKGDHMEYLLFHNEFMEAVMNNATTAKMKQDGLLFSFIMAEKYHDTIAAFDFCEILEAIDSDIDTITLAYFVDFLVMASKSKPDPLSFLASRRLYEIYSNGKYGMAKNQIKADYYNKLSDTIASKMHF
jgi:hypothetical protein